MSTNFRNNNMKQGERRVRRYYQKPQWEIEKENAEKLAEEKRKAEEKGLENTEENFPVLGGSHRPSISRPSIKFTGLNWDKMETETRAVTSEYKDNYHVVLPKFNNVHNYRETDDYVETSNTVEKPNESEWTTIEKKIHKKKSVLDTDAPPEDSVWDNEDGQERNEDTVWGGETEDQPTDSWTRNKFAYT